MLIDRKKRLLIEVSVIVVVILVTAVFVNKIHNSQIKVLYSLDKRSNDKELIHLIDNAGKFAYFAIYYFTKNDIADALVRAKKRGVTVRGIMDREASMGSNKAVLAKLEGAGIDVETQKHQDGIMHLKVLVTEDAYASGSYNWTQSATEANDEVLEIGTNRKLRDMYRQIVLKVLKANE